MAKTGAIEKLKAMAKDRVDAKALKDFVAAGKDVPLSYKGREHVWDRKVKKYAAGGSANSKGKASNLSVLEMGDMSSPAYRAHLERKQGLDGSYPETFVAPAVRGAASAAKGFLGNLGKTKPGQLPPGHYEFANARRDAAMSQLTKQEMDTFYRTGNLPLRFPELLENASAIGSKVGRIPMPKPEKKTLQEHLVEGVMTPAGRRSAVDLGLNTANQMSDIYDRKGFAPAGDGKADSYAAGGGVSPAAQIDGDEFVEAAKAYGLGTDNDTLNKIVARVNRGESVREAAKAVAQSQSSGEAKMQAGGDPSKPYIGYRRAGRRPESQQDRAASANIPVAVARGLVSGTLGMPADLLNLPGAIYSGITGKESYELPFGSEYIEKRLPLRGASQTPVGQMFTGASQLVGGAYTGPGSGARAVMAVPKAIKRAGQDFVQSAGQTVSPLTVYHGSPHKFDKFDSSKIGTGEGAQAYGHGLYLAESPNVAKTYQPRSPKFEEKLIGLYQKASSSSNYPMMEVLEDAMLHRTPSEIIQKFANAEDGYTKQHAKAAEDFAKWYSKNEPEVGGLYTVDLPDEKIARMLDWDKPLSEQSDFVKQKIKENELDYVPEHFTGERLLEEMHKGFEPGMVSKHLRDAGIPGVKYFDEASRRAKEGTRNFVVFPGEEDALTILERKKAGGEVKMAGGGAAFGRYTTGKKYQGAVKRAREADVNTLADPRTYAFVSGLLGSAPDELGFSVMHPDYEGIQKVGEKGFMGGTILGVAPMVGPMTKGLPVGASIKPTGAAYSKKVLDSTAARFAEKIAKDNPKLTAEEVSKKALTQATKKLDWERTQKPELEKRYGDLVKSSYADSNPIKQQNTAAVVQERMRKANEFLDQPTAPWTPPKPELQAFDRSAIKDALEGFPGVEQSRFPRDKPARANIEHVEELYGDPANRALIKKQINRGLPLGGETFYASLYPVKLATLEKGMPAEKFDHWIHGLAPASARNSIMNEMAVGQFLRDMNSRGIPLTEENVAREMAVYKEKFGVGLPLMPIHRQGVANVLEGGQNLRDMNLANIPTNYKIPTYGTQKAGDFANSAVLDVHEAGGQTQGSRFHPYFNEQGGFGNTEYGAGEQGLLGIAEEMGIPGGMSQAGRWFGGGELTGLKSPRGDALDLLEKQVAYTLKQKGIQPNPANVRAEVLKQIETGQGDLLPWYRKEGMPDVRETGLQRAEGGEVHLAQGGKVGGLSQAKNQRKK